MTKGKYLTICALASITVLSLLSLTSFLIAATRSELADVGKTVKYVDGSWVVDGRPVTIHYRGDKIIFGPYKFRVVNPDFFERLPKISQYKSASFRIIFPEQDESWPYKIPQRFYLEYEGMKTEVELFSDLHAYTS